jgi:hypothetical protein
MEWGKEAADGIEAWVEEAYGDDHSLTLNRSRFVHDDQEARFIVFGAHSEQDDDEVTAREKWRMDSVVEQLGAEIRDGAEPTSEGAPPP